ncbi:Hypothetical predicted protein [Paramuricea clavata]|uniref:Uncharacterized protein n=1 Tax=Paramuricea clavata TaxID=317549 RepID=A0A7D9HIH8_PARCT|nr:Hypothetical predicted protein [Paramuricea clavata]
MAHVTGLLGGYKLSVVRKMDVTNKLTNVSSGGEFTTREIKVHGGTFYSGIDFGVTRGKTVRHYYTLKRYLLFERFEQLANNKIIIPVSNSTVKTPLPNCLLTIRNVRDLDDNVKFIFERTGGYEQDSFALAADVPNRKRRIANKKGKKSKRGKKTQKGGFGPAAGIALGMALPMLLNTGTSVVGSIFGKKPAQKPVQSVNQGGNRAPPSWMQDRPPPRRHRRRYYDDDYY